MGEGKGERATVKTFFPKMWLRFVWEDRSYPWQRILPTYLACYTPSLSAYLSGWAPRVNNNTVDSMVLMLSPS